MTNYERLKTLAAEEMARAICFRGMYDGVVSAEKFESDKNEFYEREVRRWTKWLQGADPRHNALWEGYNFEEDM